MDPPEHSEHRRMVLNEFTAARLAPLRPRVQSIVDRCIDKMLAAGPPADLVRGLAMPLPSLVICELLGVDYADRVTFQRRSAVLDSRDSAPQEKMAAFQELRAFLGDLVTAKAEKPADDLLSRLITRYREAGAYDHEVLSGLAMLLLTAGYESTANMIALGALALVEHPEQRDRLAADPGLTGRAVDELLRYFSVAEVSTSRVTTADLEVGGVTIPAGAGVIVAMASANRDEQVFANPDRLDV